MTIRDKDPGFEERVKFRARSVFRHPCLFGALFSRYVNRAITDNWPNRRALKDRVHEAALSK